MELFKRALEDLLEIEGFFSDDKDDKGGKTKYGITENTARNYGFKGEMRDLTLEIATDIYYINYWLRAKLGDVSDISPMIAKEIFDSGVNCGIPTAVRWFQKSINNLSHSQIKVDGKMGPKTMKAFEKINHYLDHTTIIKMMNVYQGMKYIGLCDVDETQKKFIRGWFRRITFS